MKALFLTVIGVRGESWWVVSVPVPLIPSVAIGAYLFPGRFPNGL